MWQGGGGVDILADLQVYLENSAGRLCSSLITMATLRAENPVVGDGVGWEGDFSLCVRPFSAFTCLCQNYNE